MNAVTPVTITTPDGVERELRFTLGARKRIMESFGCNMKEALDKYDSGAFPGLLFALMHNADGRPPAVSSEWLAENIPVDAENEILAAIMSAGTQGKTAKKDIEALLRVAREAQIKDILKLNGSISGASALSVSESVPETSGMDSLSVNSKPESDGTNAISEIIESSLEPLPLPV